ncbi:peptidyl-prolyl cis-trans isomerase-like 2 [Cryptococcus neoformans 125.91]|nr:peptidyl-prolyl cis-trans isomerase-like 2 [Cryptococcus neoformans var. grubii 125.91]
MGHNSDKLYVTHSEHAAGSHTASSFGKRQETGKSEFQRLPFDCCALSLQPFRNPVAVISETKAGEAPRADVFDLLNIVPYIRKFKSNPVTGKPLETSQLVKLNFFRNAEGNLHDPITYKVFSPHIHIVFLKNTGNVFDMTSLQLLAIKPKTWRDLVNDEPFKREDIITIQDPQNLAARDLREYDYVKKDLKVSEDELAGDPLRGINVDAAGGASKVLKMIAEKNKSEQSPTPTSSSKVDDGKEQEKKKGVVAKRKVEQMAYNASNYSSGRAAASLTSTSLMPETKSERAMFDEEEYMFEELSRPTKDKDRQKSKAYATITTNFGPLNVELHGDRAPKTVYNFVQLAKAGKYDNVVFHRLIPGFMVQGGDPTGTGRGGESYWGEPFRDEHSEKGAYKHDSRGVLSMANSGPRTNGSQFFFTFRPTPHLDGKHTVFGKLVGGEETLDKIERVNVRPGGDRPVRDIVILGVSVLQDPFEAYQARLQARLARQDQSDAALKRRAEAQKEREKDRTTWLGTNLGERGGGGKVGKRRGEDVGGVGKYLKVAGGGGGGGGGKKWRRRRDVSDCVGSLLASPVHPALFPLPRFAVLHAVRVTLVWATLTKNTRRHKQHAGGRMQDLFGYLVMGWAGNTTLSILLALPPSWLISPTPWLVYPLVYLLLIPTGISAWIVDHVPEVLVNTVGAAVDGLTRGVTIASIGTMVGASGKFPGPEVSAWTYTLLSALAVSSGGFVVSLFSLHEPSYRLSVPSVFRRGAGAWGTMDVWAAGLAGLGYWAMERLSVEDVKGVPGVGRLRGLAGGSEMGNGDEPLMDSLAARTSVLFLHHGEGA